MRGTPHARHRSADTSCCSSQQKGAAKGDPDCFARPGIDGLNRRKLQREILQLSIRLSSGLDRLMSDVHYIIRIAVIEYQLKCIYRLDG
jgi:hypothetical protein